jgi:tetratricopeptide (TPR) repeat protein
VPDYKLDLCETLARPTPPGRPGEPNSDARTQDRLREAVELSAELVKDYPNVPEYTAAHARYLDEQGTRLFQARNLSEAEKLHRKAVDFQSKVVKNYPEVVAYSLWLGLMERSLGRVLAERGDLKEARARLEAAVARVDDFWKRDSRLTGLRPFLGTAYRDLAQVLRRVDEPARAAEAQHKADEFGKPGGPPGQRPRGMGRP